MNTFGYNLRTVRKNKGLKQHELAKIMNISTVMVSQYELNKRNPKPETIRKFKEALGCSYEDLGLQETYWGSFILPGSATKDGLLEVFQQPKELDDKTEEIIKCIDHLNESGKEKVLAYIYDLLDNPKYKLPVL